MKFIRLYFLITSLFYFSQGLFAFEAPKTSLLFTENKGQVGDQFYKPRPDILFSANDGKIVYHFKNAGFSYQLNKVTKWTKTKFPGNSSRLKRGMRDSLESEFFFYRIDVNWLNFNNSTTVQVGNALQGVANYYSEVCPAGVTGVRSFETITYKNIYKGIDVKWYQVNNAIKYDYIVAPGASYKQIKLEFKGAEKISINKNGELVIKNPLGEIREQKPLVRQGNRLLNAKWVVKNNIVSFDIKGVDSNSVLIIDPLVRLWGTYYGGQNQDDGWYSVCDGSGNVYLTGDTRSSTLNNIATSGAYQTIYAGGASGAYGGDAFIAKFTPGGVRIWGTYYGGSGSEVGQNCVLHPSGDIYLTGNTTTTNSAVMSTPGVYQTVFNGGTSLGDGFIVRFNGAGARVWGSYFGGVGDEWNFAVSYDSFSGDVYVGGNTPSSLPANCFATPGAFQTTFGGVADGFIIRFNSVGARVWGTYFGGSLDDSVYGCCNDANGNLYIFGETWSANNIATPGAHQTAYGGGLTWGDGFIAKFNPSGNLLWSSYYGGSGGDWTYNGVTDASGNIYFSGMTSSSTGTVISTPGSHQPAFGGAYDGFLVKFSPAGVRQWGTYYGGAMQELYTYCTMNVFGDIYISGETNTPSGFPIATMCTYQEFNGGLTDAFLAKFNQAGVRQWGTFYGGAGSEEWPATANDPLGNVYLVGRTSSASGTVIASSGSHQPTFGGLWDAFLVKFDGCNPILPPNTTPPPDMIVCYGENTSLTTTLNCGTNWYSGLGGNVIGSGSVFPTPTLAINTTFYIGDASCGPPTTLTAVEVTVNPLPNIVASASPGEICSGNAATLTASGASSYSWASPQQGGSQIVINPTVSSVYYVTGSDGICSNSASVNLAVVNYPQLNLNYPSNSVCYNQTLQLGANGAQSYSWFPPALISQGSGSLVTTIPINSSSGFTVVGVNSGAMVSCTSQAQFSINVIPQINTVISPSLSVCYGNKATVSVIGGNTYYWSGVNVSNPNQNVTDVYPAASTVYSVDVSVNSSCPVTATVFVKVNSLPEVNAGRDTVVNVGDPVILMATGDGTLKWISGESIGCADCPVTNVYPYTRSCYVIESTDIMGCKAQDEVCVEIVKDYGIYIPNTFTPNNDGINDIFYVYGFGIKNYKLTIYNRWGIKLYVSEDQTKGWDGIYNGEICKPDTYTYYVDFMPYKGKHETMAGHVNIIK